MIETSAHRATLARIYRRDKIVTRVCYFAVGLLLDLPSWKSWAILAIVFTLGVVAENKGRAYRG